jgi:hypothetical protein
MYWWEKTDIKALKWVKITTSDSTSITGAIMEVEYWDNYPNAYVNGGYPYAKNEIEPATEAEYLDYLKNNL